MLETLLPLFIVLAAIGAISGTVSFFLLLFQRKQPRAGVPTADGSADAQSELLAVREQMGRLVRALTEVQNTALFNVVTELYTTPGSPTQTNALWAVLDRGKQNGVLVHTFGNPQIRVLPIKDGRALPPGGTIRAVEEAFLRKVQGATPPEERQ